MLQVAGVHALVLRVPILVQIVPQPAPTPVIMVVQVLALKDVQTPARNHQLQHHAPIVQIPAQVVATPNVQQHAKVPPVQTNVQIVLLPAMQVAMIRVKAHVVAIVVKHALLFVAMDVVTAVGLDAAMVVEADAPGNAQQPARRIVKTIVIQHVKIPPKERATHVQHNVCNIVLSRV